MWSLCLSWFLAFLPSWHLPASHPSPPAFFGILSFATHTGCSWELTRQDAYCGQSVRKNIGRLIAVADCQAMVLEDAECSNVMYGDGEY
jgi:hypothetical protein